VYWVQKQVDVFNNTLRQERDGSARCTDDAGMDNRQYIVEVYRPTSDWAQSLSVNERVNDNDDDR